MKHGENIAKWDLTQNNTNESSRKILETCSNIKKLDVILQWDIAMWKT